MATDWNSAYRQQSRATRAEALRRRRWWILGVALAGALLLGALGGTWPARAVVAVVALITISALGAGIVVLRAQGRARQGVLDAWAVAHGFLPATIDVLPPFSLLRSGESRRVECAYSGTVGGRYVTWCNYTYETSSTDANGNRTIQRHPYTVLLFGHEVPVAHLRLTRRSLGGFGRGVGDRIDTGLSSLQAVAVENDRFARRWQLMIDDADARHMAYFLFPPTLQEQLAAGGALSGDIHAVEAADGVAMAAWRRHTGPGELAALEVHLAEASALLDRWPAR